ncbi:AraC family transcriptional regulator [Gordonia crocea]|nr:AraC family transcriptional regulator [Gordonia crocea]
MLLIRGSSLSGFDTLVGDCGGDAVALLAAAGVDPGDVGDHERFIVCRNAVLAVETAAAVLDVADFGRRLADLQSIDILGPVGVAARTAGTVGEALGIFDTYMDTYSAAILAQVGPGPDDGLARFEYSFLMDPAPPQAQSIELALGLTLRVFRTLLGTAYRPVAVHLPHSALGLPSSYRYYFGCSPRFDEPVAGFTVRAADLERPLGRDPLVHQVAMNYLVDVMAHRERAIVGSVRSVLRQLLPTRRLNIDLVAGQFNLHPKALQRRLAAEGTSLAELVDQTRRDIAERLLVGSDLSVAQVARQLGYTEQSTLTRACRRWFDASPTELRARG